MNPSWNNRSNVGVQSVSLRCTRIYRHPRRITHGRRTFSPRLINPRCGSAIFYTFSRVLETAQRLRVLYIAFSLSPFTSGSLLSLLLTMDFLPYFRTHEVNQNRCMVIVTTYRPLTSGLTPLQYEYAIIAA
jgi:hypothetical protein